MRKKFSWLLIIAGLLLIVSPALKTGYSLYMQKVLLQDMEESASAVTSSAEPVTVSSPVQVPAITPAEPESKIKSILVLNIPELAIKAAVVEGVTSRDLSRGPGWYPSSSLPGETGNVAIAGHRNVFGSWFRNLNKLESGDQITIVYKGQTFNYTVERVFIVAENDWSVVAPTPYKALTLTTCDPPGNVTQRLIVRARQID